MDLEELYNTITNDLENSALKQFDSKEDFIKWNDQRIKDQGYKSYRLSVPEIEKIVKKYIALFKDLSFNERVTLIRKFYTSEFIGQTNFGLKLLELSIPQITPNHFMILDEIAGCISHWGPTDSFSLNIMQPLLKAYPNETKKMLQTWNKSDYLWKKRASVVTFTRKVGVEGNHVDFLLKLCDNLLWDKEDLVRKAVGWALKDNMIGKNKQKVLNYVKELRTMGVSSTITLYAIRKLEPAEKEEILKLKPLK